MGKVLSGDYSGCSVRANKKSLKIEYISVSSPLDKRNIIEHELISRDVDHSNVRVKYINNGYERESDFQLSEKEFQVLMVAIQEQANKPVVAAKAKAKAQVSTKTSNKVKPTLKCQHCQEEKPRDQFTIVNVRPSAYCNSCNEEFTRKREECAAKNGETALWRLIGFESKEQFIANMKGEFVKWNNGYEIVTSGKWKTMSNGEPATYRWKGRVFKNGGEWIATRRNGMIKVREKTREEAADELLNLIYNGALHQFIQASPSKPKKSGFWTTIKMALGLKLK